MSSPQSIWIEYRHRPSVWLRNQIAQQNDKLALGVAHRWVGQCSESIEDLAQIGRIGLLKAIERYDPSKGAAFSSFAVPYIHGEIQHFLRDHFGVVKIPRRAFEEAGKVRRLQGRMAKAGRMVGPDVAAEAIGISEQRWNWICEAVQRKQTASLDEILELADESEQESRQLLASRLQERIAALPSQQRRCLTSRFFQQRSVEAIARAENLSAEQVQTTLEAVIVALKTDLEGVYAECY